MTYSPKKISNLLLVAIRVFQKPNGNQIIARKSQNRVLTVPETVFGC